MPETSSKKLNKILLRLVLAVVLLTVAFPWLYEVKSRMGIDIVRGVHAGRFLERHSGGIIKCTWLYPYHYPCPGDRVT